MVACESVEGAVESVNAFENVQSAAIVWAVSNWVLTLAFV